MDWLQRMNEAMNYIEDNLCDVIDYEEAAKLACCTSYHFQRMFAFITDTPMSEYIRRRRLTLAAFELQNKDNKVIDVALKYGYNSPNSFARAFQIMHGITPSIARNKGVTLKAYPRLSFHITIKGDVEMNYRVEEKKSFRMFGVDKTFSVIGGQCFQEIPTFWLEAINNKTLENILLFASNNPSSIVGDIYGNEEMLVNAAMYGHKKDGTLKYMLCAYAPEGEIPKEYIELNVPALTWAIFPTEKHKMEQTTVLIQDIWKRIYSEWFPTSDYEHADAPQFEMYHKLEEDQFIVEVWIPVVSCK